MFADLSLGIVPGPALETSLASYQNAINANPAGHTFLGQELIDITHFETLYLLARLLTI